MALIKEQSEGNNELSNLLGNDWISGKADILLGQLLLIISKNIFLEPGSSHFLDLLLYDSDFKTICDYIHLLLLLN